MTKARIKSMLFMPAVREDLIAKGPRSGADAMVIDCEDATPADRKDEARVIARRMTDKLNESPVSVFVRVNSVASEWFLGDVARALTSRLAGVIVPKIETLDQLDTVGTALASAGLGSLSVLAGLETALGVADSRRLLAHPMVSWAYFGAEDFAVDMGGQRTESNSEVAYARSLVALSGRLASVPVLDQIVANYGDDDRFRREVAEARALGYSGKLCIHPAQVALANEGFVSSEAEVARARALLAAYEDGKARGVASVAFEGSMVDEPLARAAQAIIDSSA